MTKATCIASTEDLLAERQKTHGDFSENARISQALKTFFTEAAASTETMFSDVQRESLDMIALKLSRILSGQPGFRDHWDDIAGYAKLASQELQRR